MGMETNLPPESWALVAEDYNYEVSTYGNVRRKAGKGSPQGKMLKLHDDGRGYYNVTIGTGTVKVHHLVAKAYIGKQPYEGWQVNHIDGNRHNNHWKNLEWVSAAHNIQVSSLHKGENHHQAKLTEDEVRFIRASTWSTRELSIKFRVSQARINQLRKGQGWEHLNQ